MLHQSPGPQSSIHRDLNIGAEDDHAEEMDAHDGETLELGITLSKERKASLCKLLKVTKEISMVRD